MTAFASRFKIFFVFWFTACAFAQADLFSGDEENTDASATIVVYNKADENSKGLADYYAAARQIPKDHIIGLDCPITEEITRLQYETTIATPLRSEFIIRGWWKTGQGLDKSQRLEETKIRFVALIRGMPLKIAPEAGINGTNQGPAERNEASVDSELACLDVMPWPITGPLSNPYYKRYVGIQDANMPPGLLLVCRLDGPTEESVLAMIDASLATEKTGLWGWAYVDMRNIREGGYKEGDDWLREAVSSMRRRGIPVLTDNAPETLPVGFPLTNAAVYYGWYDGNPSGPFADPRLRLRPGSIAVHIHSFSANTLRNPSTNWAGPLVMRGAAATVGNVYEPYLSMTTNLDILQDRLMGGFTFAESAYMAIRSVSWMGVVVGDPLYRPYKVWQDLTRSDAPETSWERYRKIILAANGDVIAAAPELRKAAKETGKSMFLESLASALADSGRPGEALAEIDAAMAMEKETDISVRLALEKITLLRGMGKREEAGAIAKEFQKRTSNPDQLQLLRSIYNQIFPPPPTPTPAPTQ